MKGMVMLRTLGLAVALAVGAGVGVAPAPAAAMSKARSCGELRQDYPGGVARSKVAAGRVVDQGYRRPIVCKRLYREVQAKRDPNRNGVACERR
jgi:Excalibur calcium-binding domain